ncbi:MAG: S-layer homology domain-containing protein, partial [Dolichospermum sp.]
MVSTAIKFSDIQNHWSRAFIEALAARGILKGYPDGTFRPDNPVTRAEFAAIMAAVFSPAVKREYAGFVDVPDTHWGFKAIKKVYESGFLTGYPNKRFGIDENIFKGDVLVAMVNGLGIAAQVGLDLVSKLAEIYQDGALIPYYGINQIAVATRVGWVVNYPQVKILNYKTAATRADVVA